MDSNNMSNVNSSNITNNQGNIIIDNRILTPKEKINNIDEKLDGAKKRLQNLYSMQENIEAIAKSMNKCIDLLSKSVRGPQVNGKFNDMRNSNRLFLIKASANIEEETMKARKKINELYKEKDSVLRENRINYNHEEEQLKQEQAERERKAAEIAKEKIFNNEEIIDSNDNNVEKSK